MFSVNLSEVMFDHFWCSKSQDGLETANLVEQILLPWTAQAVLFAFSCAKKTSTKRA